MSNILNYFQQQLLQKNLINKIQFSLKNIKFKRERKIIVTFLLNIKILRNKILLTAIYDFMT